MPPWCIEQKFSCIKLNWPIQLEDVSISKKQVIVKLLQKNHFREETNLVALNSPLNPH